MKIIYKTTLIALVLSFLFACNFCLVECAFSSEEHHHSVQLIGSVGHHHESDGDEDHSNSDKHDAGSLCCSSLVAIQNSSIHPTDIRLVKEPFFKTVILGRLIPQLGTHSPYQIEFPPGASPPAVFLLTHFTHAPPISL